MMGVIFGAVAAAAIGPAAVGGAIALIAAIVGSILGMAAILECMAAAWKRFRLRRLMIATFWVGAFVLLWCVIILALGWLFS